MKKLLILTLALCAVLPVFGQEWKGYGIKSGYLKTATTLMIGNESWVIKQKHSESVIELMEFKENPKIPASTFAIPE